MLLLLLATSNTRTTMDTTDRSASFDEQIVAKRNRSKLSLSKGLTPFLNDASMAVTRTYTVPGPVTLGVTAGKSYRYSEFPALDARELQIAVDARSGCGR